MLSPCGVNCHDDCREFNKTCEGCRAITGKVFWAQYVNKTICPIYECCLDEMHFEDCGECSKLPCNIYFETRDPSVSEEEHKAGIDLRVKLLLDKPKQSE